MELKEIAAISGKPGLFKIFKPSKSGVIVETLDSQKKKLAIPSAGKVSILKEISIYTTETDGSVPLAKILQLVKQKYDANLPVSGKSETADLMKFLSEIVPNYDATKVYPSDVKKLVTWYAILYKEAPETLLPQAEEVKEEVETPVEKAPVTKKTTAKAEKAVKAEEAQPVEKAKKETVKKEPAKKAEPKEKAEPKAKKEPVKKAEPKAKVEKVVKEKVEKPKVEKVKAEPKAKVEKPKVEKTKADIEKPKTPAKKK